MINPEVRVTISTSIHSATVYVVQLMFVFAFIYTVVNTINSSYSQYVIYMKSLSLLSLALVINDALDCLTKKSKAFALNVAIISACFVVASILPSDLLSLYSQMEITGIIALPVLAMITMIKKIITGNEVKIQ